MEPLCQERRVQSGVQDERIPVDTILHRSYYCGADRRQQFPSRFTRDAYLMGMQILDAFPCDHYLSLVPWARLNLRHPDFPPPLSYLGGVASEVAASLQEAHGLLFGDLTAAISDMVVGRVSLGDHKLRVLVEDAYTELVQSRPHLRAHIRCGREPDGTFRWEFPKEDRKSVV